MLWQWISWQSPSIMSKGNSNLGGVFFLRLCGMFFNWGVYMAFLLKISQWKSVFVFSWGTFYNTFIHWLVPVVGGNTWIEVVANNPHLSDLSWAMVSRFSMGWPVHSFMFVSQSSAECCTRSYDQTSLCCLTVVSRSSCNVNGATIFKSLFSVPAWDPKHTSHFTSINTRLVLWVTCTDYTS